MTATLRNFEGQVVQIEHKERFRLQLGDDRSVLFRPLEQQSLAVS